MSERIPTVETGRKEIHSNLSKYGGDDERQQMLECLWDALMLDYNVTIVAPAVGSGGKRGFFLSKDVNGVMKQGLLWLDPDVATAKEADKESLRRVRASLKEEPCESCGVSPCVCGEPELEGYPGADPRGTVVSLLHRLKLYEAVIECFEEMGATGGRHWEGT